MSNEAVYETIGMMLKRLGDLLNTGDDIRRPIKLTLIARHQGSADVYTVFTDEQYGQMEKVKECVEHYIKHQRKPRMIITPSNDG